MDIEKILKDVIEIPSVSSDAKACKEAIDYIEKLAKENNLKSKVYEKNSVYSLLIAKEIKSSYEILFNGHMDVVPAPRESFKAQFKVKGGKRFLYGRGSSDMKGGNIAMLVAMIELLSEEVDKDMAILLTTDEELGGFNGVKYVLDNGLRADIIFIPDGGKDWSVCTDEKGVLHLKFQSKGISAHGSRPWDGKNALESLIEVYANLKDTFIKNWGEAIKEDCWKPTVNLGALNGGNAANKVPNEASMLIDIRYPASVTQKELEKIAEDVLVDGVEFEIISTGQPLHIDMENKYLKKWLDLLDEKELEKAHGASDGRFFAQKGMNVIITKPKMSEPHIDNEWIDIDDLILFKDKIKLWVKSI